MNPPHRWTAPLHDLNLYRPSEEIKGPVDRGVERTTPRRIATAPLDPILQAVRLCADLAEQEV